MIRVILILLISCHFKARTVSLSSASTSTKEHSPYQICCQPCMQLLSSITQPDSTALKHSPYHGCSRPCLCARLFDLWHESSPRHHSGSHPHLHIRNSRLRCDNRTRATCLQACAWYDCMASVLRLYTPQELTHTSQLDTPRSKMYTHTLISFLIESIHITECTHLQKHTHSRVYTP